MPKTVHDSVQVSPAIAHIQVQQRSDRPAKPFSIQVSQVTEQVQMQEVKATLTAAMKYRTFLAMNSWLSTTVTRSLTASDVAQQIGAKVDRKKHKRHHSRCLSFCNNHRSCASIQLPPCWQQDG